MVKRCTLFIVLFAGLAFMVQAQDLANGKAKYNICLACHLANGQGNKILNSPAIAGQEDWYLERQINAFKNGQRGKKDPLGAQMVPMVATLATDKDVKDVSAFIAQMKPVKREAPTVKGDAVAGKKLYAICATCHGADGKGLQVMNSPNLTLQQDWYVERQIQYFKDHLRGYDPKDVYGQQMVPMVATLANKQAIKDVVAYIMTLPQ